MRSDKIVNIESCLRKQNKKIAMIRHQYKIENQFNFWHAHKKTEDKIVYILQFQFIFFKIENAVANKKFYSKSRKRTRIFNFFFLINVYYHFRITIFFPSLIFSNIFLVTGNNLRSRIENVRCPVLSCGTYSGQTSNF